jgi:hypothetical protein
MYPRIILILLGGVLAASGLILAKKPDAKELLNKIVPYQGLIGVALLAYGLFDLITNLDLFKLVLHFKPPLFCLTLLGWFIGSIILGIILGTPVIGKYAGGGNEEKVMNVQKKLLPFQTIFGVIGIVVGVLMLLYQLNILKVA